ncbi:MAG: chemotaxis protein CheW [Deltaproteobacteria bacterium]|nr:chemotaxis protein CheW [Deltaproteobacteria bacterium]
MDNSRFKAVFLQEVYERLSGIEKGLLALESDPQNSAAVDALFRHYHSIKGMSASMGYETMKVFTHAQEGLLDRLRTTGEAPSSEMISLLLSSLDALKDMTRRIEENIPLPPIGYAGQPAVLDGQPAVLDGQPAVLDGDGINIERLLNKIKELSASPAVHDAQPAVHDGWQPPPPAHHEAALNPAQHPEIRLPNIMKVESRVFDELLRIAGDILSSISGMRTIAARSRTIELKEGTHAIGRSAEELRSNILSARMIPLDDLTENLPRIVRDISARGAKDTSFTVSGGDITLDRAILGGLSDPLVHVIRNAVDHGIETPEERALSGKPPKGAITLSACEKKDNIVIEVADDGRGIDVKGLRKKAIGMGMDKNRVGGMSDKEALMLVCVPGLSLSPEITDISGRGVGMDAVKNAVESAGGTLDVKSVPGRGTSVIMELPRTAAIMKVLLVRAGDEVMAVPVARIERVIELDRELDRELGREPDGIETEKGMISCEGRNIRARKLGDIFGITPREEAERMKVVILNAGGNGAGLFGIAVDGIEDEVNMYIRPLAPPFSALGGVAGFSVTGDGRPVFLLDVAEMAERVLGNERKGH